MRYPDGQEICIGDVVAFGSEHHGAVVVDIDGQAAAPPHVIQDWASLVTGVVIDTSFGGLVHYQDEATLEGEAIALIRRAQ